MSLQRHNDPALPAPVGPYVHAVRHGDTLYLSGLTAFGTPAQDGPIEAQAEAIFGQMASIAHSAGSDPAHLVKVTLFVTELEPMETLAELYDGRYPASSLVRVAGLFAPRLKIEIEAVLAIPGQRLETGS